MIGDLIYAYHISPTELFGMRIDRIEWLYGLMNETNKRFTPKGQQNGEEF